MSIPKHILEGAQRAKDEGRADSQKFKFQKDGKHVVVSANDVLKASSKSTVAVSKPAKKEKK